MVDADMVRMAIQGVRKKRSWLKSWTKYLVVCSAEAQDDIDLRHLESQVAIIEIWYASFYDYHQA